VSDWLELELADRLAPVRAPEALWARVQRPRVAERVRATRLPRRALVALAAVAVATIVAVALAVPSPGMSEMAAAELAANRPADFRSSDPHAIAHWLRANAGVNVSIPESAKVELTGARVKGNIGEVLYRVQGHDAVLLVARANGRPVDTRHGQSTWQAHGQIYALAYADTAQARLACQLCHAD
jgi:hypothetical protein